MNQCSDHGIAHACTCIWFPRGSFKAHCSTFFDHIHLHVYRVQSTAEYLLVNVLFECWRFLVTPPFTRSACLLLHHFANSTERHFSKSQLATSLCHNNNNSYSSPCASMHWSMHCWVSSLWAVKLFLPVSYSLVPRPPPQLLLLTVRKNRGRPGIIYHMSDIKLERRVERTAAWNRLIECSTVSCTETDGSHALAVSLNSKCQKRSILTCQRVVLAVNLASFQRGHWTPVWTSQLAAGTILETLRIDLWTTIYYGVTW